MVLHRELPSESRKAKELAQYLFRRRPDFGWVARNETQTWQALRKQRMYLRRAVGMRDRRAILHAAAYGSLPTSTVWLLLSHPLLATAGRAFLTANHHASRDILLPNGDMDPRFVEEVARLLEREREPALNLQFALQRDVVHARDMARIIQAAVDRGIVSREEAVFALSDPTIFQDLTCALGLTTILQRDAM